MASNNRSWLSSSSFGSRDHEDDNQSLDSFSKDQQQQNSSINSGSSTGGMPNRIKSRGDRYNHYRRDAPSKVKPWMRDKAITGSTGSRTGRFGGSALVGVRSPRVLPEAASVGSNSCANSVSSHSSLPEAPAHPFPSEVVPSTPSSSRSLPQEMHYDDESMTALEEVKKEPFLDDGIPRTEKEEPKLPAYDAQDETATVDTETASTAETAVPAAEEKSDFNNNETKESLSIDEKSRLYAEDEKSDKDGSPVAAPESEVTINTKPGTTIPPEAVAAEPPDSIAEGNAACSVGADGAGEGNAQVAWCSDDICTLALTEIAETCTNNFDHPEDFHKLEAAPPKALEVILPKGEEITKVENAAAEPASTFVPSKLEKRESRGPEEEYYDVLNTSVQPSSYNPMAATSSKKTTEKPSAYSTLENPSLLVEAQAAFLNDAIAEASEEETSLDEEECNVHNMSGDTLQGIKALDATREESFVEKDDVDFEISRIEHGKDLLETILPFDWEQRQTLAAGATQTWIQSRLQPRLQGNDSRARAYSEFAAALSDCPALTTMFLASDSNSGRFCFCPCSAQMRSWMTDKLSDTEFFLYGDGCTNQQLTPRGLVQHCVLIMKTCGDFESRAFHGIVHQYLESLFGPNHVAFQPPAVEQPDNATTQQCSAESNVTPNAQKPNKELMMKKINNAEEKLEATSIEASATAAENEEHLKQIREDMKKLEASNKELSEKLKLAEETKQELSAKSIETAAASAEQNNLLNRLRADLKTSKMLNTKLQEKLKKAEGKESLQEAQSTEKEASAAKLGEDLKALQEAIKKSKTEKSDLETKNATAAATLKDQAGMLESFNEDVKRLGEANAELTGKLQLAEEKYADAVASAEAQAEMMNGLCEEMKHSEEEKTALQQKLEKVEETARSAEAKLINTTATINTLNQEKVVLEEANATMLKNLTAAEDGEKAQASRDQNVTLVHVGDMPVDLRRFSDTFINYFNKLRVSQLKSHCVRDKSPVKLVLEYDAQDKEPIDIQKLLDKGAAVKSQDATYLFRELDTFNKGHFHTHKLLLPWKLVTKSGGFVSRSEFFVQLWNQLRDLKIHFGEKKTELPLFQESLGYLIPMPNAVLEGMLRVTPAELDRIFAAKISPYYRAVGRLMVQCIAATADDSADYNLKISGSIMPLILRQKLFRGIDPVDESYPLEQLLDHAFSLLGMADMTRDKAFEYFSIEAKDYTDTQSAVKRIREEVQIMWIQERSLALEALEEGLTLNGLADVSFCCGLVPLEAVNEIFFTR